jgi:hypothetical protein
MGNRLIVHCHGGQLQCPQERRSRARLRGSPCGVAVPPRMSVSPIQGAAGVTPTPHNCVQHNLHKQPFHSCAPDMLRAKATRISSIINDYSSSHTRLLGARTPQRPCRRAHYPAATAIRFRCGCRMLMWKRTSRARWSLRSHGLLAWERPQPVPTPSRALTCSSSHRARCCGGRSARPPAWHTSCTSRQAAGYMSPLIAQAARRSE